MFIKDGNFDKWGRKINPKDYAGNTSHSGNTSQSIYHWTNKYPDKNNDVNNHIFWRNIWMLQYKICWWNS